jgi:hypothetical protein
MGSIGTYLDVLKNSFLKIGIIMQKFELSSFELGQISPKNPKEAQP